MWVRFQTLIAYAWPPESRLRPPRAREKHGALTAAGGCRWEAEYRVVADERDQIEAALKQLVRLSLLSRSEPGISWELSLSSSCARITAAATNFRSL